MINISMYDPMDLFTCENCNQTSDRDMSYRINGKLVCNTCAKELLNASETNSNNRT